MSSRDVEDGQQDRVGAEGEDRGVSNGVSAASSEEVLGSCPAASRWASHRRLLSLHGILRYSEFEFLIGAEL